MSVERENAVVDNTIILRNNFKYSQTGDYFNPSAISKVEILDSDGVTVIETLTGASIVQDATGQYHVIATAVATPKTIYDKWYFTPASGAAAITKTNTCIVWAVATETSATAKIDIINKALNLIGAESITSITEGTVLANTMNTVYTLALKSILSECLWGFATKRALLVTSSTEMAWYYTSQGEAIVYAKPTDIIRIFGTNDDFAKWREEGNYIISDTAGLGIKYVYYNDDPTTYTASFIDAFIDLLAYQATFKIANSASGRAELFEKYEKVSLPKARSENSQVGAQQHVRDDAWELAKYSDSHPEA